MYRHRLKILIILLLNLTSISPVCASEFISLESEVFMSESDKLYKIEQTIVQKLENSSIKNDVALSVKYYYLLSHLYLRLYTLDTSRFGLIDNATKLADQAISLDPKGEFGYLAAAEIASILNKDDVASKQIAAAEATSKQSWRISFFKARLKAGEKGVGATLADLKEIWQRPEANRRVVMFYILGLLKTSFGPKEQVLELVKMSRILPSQELSLAMANAFLTVGLYEDALSIYLQCVALDPQHQEAQISIAAILYHFLGKKERAKNILLSLTARNDLSAENRESVLLNLGLLELKENAPTNAQKYFVLLLKEGEDKVSLFFQVASLYCRLARYKELLALIDIVNDEIIPGHAEIYALKGEILNKKIFDLSNSLEAYERAVVLDQETKVNLGTIQ